ncbi:MAG: FAD-dependent oxidoreductase [Alcaligenaceae bacterium]|nr:FAD-dependent oxidoreductase [Alcaligenaceae bacterium]
MTETIETQVVIVGAGPVGLTLAMDLASRGVSVCVIEQRHPNDTAPVKCNHTSARSMEIFRRLGVADALRSTGLPPDYPHSISYRITSTGKELANIPIPSRQQRFTMTSGPDCGWPTPEPPHRINQIFLEPVLVQHAARYETLRIIYQTAFESFSQDDQGVEVHCKDLLKNKSFTIRARFMVGCDGGKSVIRNLIGARFEGDAVIQRCQSTYIRAPKLLSMMSEGPAWATFSLNPRRCGNMYAIDGIERWLIHNYLKDDEPDFESVDRDACIRDILGVGPEFEYEVISTEDWYGRRLVANRFRNNRVFLCGDSAHIWVPYAGYGMNAGIADAANLAWLMAAYLNGWANYAILDAYERERLPITQQVSRFVMNHCIEMARQRRQVPENIEEDSPAGEAARLALGQAAYALNVQQYACKGLNFGYFYDDSPIIAYDGGEHPAYAMADYTPSTVPGCRIPHVWLADGRSLYDALEGDYALLRFDPALDVSGFVSAAARRGLPFRVIDLSPEEGAGLYQHGLVISRPDQHVAWRGNAMPVDVENLVARLCGAAH